jgi:hypothetical protein
LFVWLTQWRDRSERPLAARPYEVVRRQEPTSIFITALDAAATRERFRRFGVARRYTGGKNHDY